MSITKERISAKIAEALSIQVADSRRHLDALLTIIKKSLAQEQDVLISGFGKFSVRWKTPRQGRNPKTGEPLELRARRVVSFKLSSILRKKLGVVDEAEAEEEAESE
ncbi:MAG: integration host factor subunit alpha [Deltaproteobacteria bacterium]|jgi:integration host factor subunit alpha|nr:integration host factor subunit alpha [Deltaproteobacteria bacterium]